MFDWLLSISCYATAKNAIAVFISIYSVGFVFFLRRFSLLYRLFHKVDRETKKNGGDLVAEVLKAHGIKQVYTLCGGHISPILVGCEKLGIRIIDTRHEATTVFAADASARLTGVVGVAAVTAGPGVTNTVTAMKNAQMAESPVLLIGGAAATLLKGRGSLQDIDQLSLFKPVCKLCTSVTHVRDVIPTLREALSVAQSGTPGPVFVEFPINVLYPYKLVRQEMGIKESKTLIQSLVNWYLEHHLSDLFAGAFESRSLTPLPVSHTMASRSQVEKCVRIIERAKQPVLLLGSQSTCPPTPIEQIRKAVESIGIPCFLGGMSRGLLGKDSPLHIRHERREALRDADVVILAGTVCDFRLSYGRVFNHHCKIIAVNRNKEQLYKNSDMFWKPTIAIDADVGSFLKSLAKHLTNYKCDIQWNAKLRERDLIKSRKNVEAANKKTETHLNPLKVLHILDEILPDDTIIVADGGDFVGSASYILRARGPFKWLDPGAFGTLGVGGGFALGAKVSRPECNVVVIYGDGSLGYSVAEFDTFTRHKLPVVAIVGNDASWSQIEREQLPMFNSSVACSLVHCSYEQVARGFGGKGYLLECSNEDKIADILKAAFNDARNGKSALVNALIGKTDFRKGSISV